MDVFNYMSGFSRTLESKESDIEDTKIDTFTDEDNGSPVTNEDIDENNDKITEREDEVQEQQKERDDEVEDESSDEAYDIEEDPHDDAAEMSAVSDYTDSELAWMSDRKIAQVLFLPYRLDASDLIILDNEIVNAGDEKEGPPIDDEGSGGGSSSDDGGGDDFDMDFRYRPTQELDYHNEEMPVHVIEYMGFWDYLKIILGILLKLSFLVKIAWKVHVNCFKFLSRHLPRLLTNIKAVSKVWDVKLVFIIPKVSTYSLDKVDVTSIPYKLWMENYNVLTSTYKWIQANARMMVKSPDSKSVDASIEKLVSNLRGVYVDWDGYKDNVDMSPLRAKRELSAIPALGYGKEVIPGMVSNLKNIGKMYDANGIKEVRNTLRIATDIVMEHYKKADKMEEGEDKNKAIQIADEHNRRLKQVHSIHRACVEISCLLATDFQAVMRGYEIACYKGVKNNEI